MPKHSLSTVAFPRSVGPSDGQLEMSTTQLNDEISANFDYMMRKQKKIRTYLGPLLKRKTHRRVKREDEESPASDSLPEDVMEALTKCENLARLSETRLKKVEDDIRERNAKMIERMELSKSAIIREVVQARRTKVNWFGPNMVVTPLDESISERQCLLGDNSDDLLELERALNQPMDI